MKRIFLSIIFVLAVSSPSARAQGNAVSDFKKWRDSMLNDYQSFRRKMLQDYVDFMRNPWRDSPSESPIPLPHRDERPPIVAPEDEISKPIEDRPVIIEEVVKPKPATPQPQPVQPFQNRPNDNDKQVAFTFYGTEEKIRFSDDMKFSLRGVDGNNVADALMTMADKYDDLIYDCLSIRKTHNLCDWAYLQMLKALGDELMGKGSNESTLMMAYIYMQSGYQIRLAHDGRKLYMLYGSRYRIYRKTSYELDGIHYYSLEELPDRLHICQAAFPQEKSMSLNIDKEQSFSEAMSAPRTITSTRYPEISVEVNVNKNLMDFYTSYPTSMIGDNVMSRWAMYANTPMQNSIRNQMYPKLRRAIEGCNQLNAVNKLLNFVQTGFEYEFDDKVWGGDRVFFAEESLYYPYCDCEDRSILFTRLVRDLLGLKCILIFYPGHLACAVCFTESVSGDYIMLEGQKFVVSDPTYIGAPVGMTMPDMDNQSAKVILLE